MLVDVEESTRWLTVWAPWVDNHVFYFLRIKMLRHIHNVVAVDVYHWMDVRHHAWDITIMIDIFGWLYDWRTFHAQRTSIWSL